MDNIKSNVYVKLDNLDRIIRCEGGYTTPADLTGWTLIDEGYGDRYNLCQSNYFPSGLYTEDGIPRYKLVDGKPVERTIEEIETDCLAPAKAAKIAKSKSDLKTYLATHPYQWTDGKQYNITDEKTGWLTSKVVAVAAAAGIGVPYNLKWNDTGMVCESWNLADLTALALAIDERVTALVTYQQEKEIEINAAKTMAELDAIVVDYDEV